MRTRAQQVFGEGLFAGLLGYVLVAAFFAVENVLTGHSPFHTAAVLGAPLVDGGPAGEGVVAAVFAYNGLHLLVFALVGMAAAWVVTETERHPVLWYLGFFAFFTGFAYDVVLMMLYAGPSGEPGWAAILGSNALAAAGMGAYLWAVHPGLWQEIRQRADPEHPERPWATGEGR